MSEIDRRRFLDESRKATLGLAGGITILANPGSVRATPANDRLVLAMIGVGGGRGHSLALGFLDRGDCQIGYICDVESRLHEPRAKEYASRQGGKRPKCVQDFREMLEDTSVDGEQGVMFMGRMGGGWQVYVRPKSRQPVVKDQMYGRFPDPDHKANFVEAVKRRTRPNADVEEGHRSMLLVHYADISCRLGGRKLQIDPKTEQILDDPEAMGLFKREYREPWVVAEVM